MFQFSIQVIVQTLQGSKMVAEFEAKITMLNESLEMLEKKVDNIEKILEKVRSN